MVIPDLPDEPLRRQIRAQLASRHLFPADGVSSVHRGTGRRCNVCGRPIDSPTREREVEGPGVVGRAQAGIAVRPTRRPGGSSGSVADRRIRLHGESCALLVETDSARSRWLVSARRAEGNDPIKLCWVVRRHAQLSLASGPTRPGGTSHLSLSCRPRPCARGRTASHRPGPWCAIGSPARQECRASHQHSVKSSEPPANPLKPPAKSVKYLGYSVACGLLLTGSQRCASDLGHADGNGTRAEGPGRSPRVSTAQTAPPTSARRTCGV